MNDAAKNLLAGSATLVVGLLLWLLTGDVDTPVVTLTKVGVVLMVIGAVEVGYGLLLAARGAGSSR